MEIIRSGEKGRNELCGDCCSQKDQFNMYYFIIKFIVALTLFFPRTSHAYLDPGTGSFIFQMIIAGVVGGLFTIKTFWRKIASLFKKHDQK